MLKDVTQTKNGISIISDVSAKIQWSIANAKKIMLGNLVYTPVSSTKSVSLMNT